MDGCSGGLKNLRIEEEKVGREDDLL